MTYWGKFTWGDGTLYGATAGSDLAWGVEVDWDGDGNFDGSNEAERVVSISAFRGRRSYLDMGAAGFSPVETGSCQVTLDNADRRYDPWNSSSPLYPNVTDGRDVRIRVIDRSTGTIYPYFYGVISNIQGSDYGSDPRVTITLEDGWRKLRRAAARVVVNENVGPDAAIGLVLDSANWPARWGRYLDSSSDNIRYFWSSGNNLAGEEIERVAKSFLGYFFIAADGKARYVSRTNAGAAVIDLSQDALLKDIFVTQPWEYRRNLTRIKVHPRTVASTGTLWQLLGSVPTIDSGTPLTLWANYSYGGVPVPGKNIVTPVATTDWTANTAANGSGTDKTGEVTLTFTNLGDTAKLVFTYSGGGIIYLTTAKIRGDAIYEVSATDVTYPADTSMITDPREFSLDLSWQQDINAAVDFSRVLGHLLETPHPYPRVIIDNRPSLQYAVDLFDIVSLSIPKIGIGGVSFRVAGIEHRTIGENCQQVQTVLYFEPYTNASSYWLWPITNFGVDTVFGW